MSFHPRVSQLCAALVVSCAAVLQGCANAPANASAASAMAAPYVKHLRLWPSEAARRPAPAAQVTSPNANIPIVDSGVFDRLTIGMTKAEVTDVLGAAVALGEPGLWQYVVRGPAGVYVTSLWFNEENRLWMGTNDRAPVASLAAALVPAPVAPPPVKLVTLSASELFPFNGDELRMPQPKLDEIVDALRGRSDFGALVINGYTDRLGSGAYNLALSQRRADAVRTYLVRAGVPANQVSAVGKGATDPIVECPGVSRHAALIECLAPNRRVEIAPLTLGVASAR